MSKPERAYHFEQFYATRRQVGFKPAPDGESIYFIADISGQFNLWRVPSAGGWPEQLTLFEKESVRDVACARDGSHIAFIADPDGNEQYQVYLMDAHGGWPERVTDRPDVQHELGGFSPDGRYLAYSANARNPADNDIFLRDVATGEVRCITPGDGLFACGIFSPDGRQYLAAQVYSNTDIDIWLFDLGSGKGRNLTAHSGEQIKHFPVGWRKDGTGFYYLTTAGREFGGLADYDLAAGHGSYMVTADWDLETAAISPDGAVLAYVVNEAGNSVLHLRDLASGAELPVPSLARGVIGAVSFAAADAQRRLFVHMGNFRQAGAVFAIDLPTGEVRQVTQSMMGNIPDEVFVEPELVHITAFDGLVVPAWLYRPQGAGAGKPVPAVLSIHGGPEAQERPGYAYGGFYQYLLNRGVAILAPNIRGSSGFGMSYQKAIHRDWGGAELKDIEACAQYLQSLTWVDSDRLAVWGGSFGGFATLSAVTRLPQYWACGCDLVGPSNLVTFAGSVPPHWKPMIRAWVGDPEDDRELLVERSPITYVDQIRCPLMVVQGANDPRVVKAESDQMVERLRGMGRDVEYLVFEDEGHGFAKRSNQLKGMNAMAEYLLRQLGVAE
ncbi:MAG: acylamino-acid-releasing enzyme [Firmicutes bacterium]|nr:acylamino-acid-releasing enzyme [Bacillota bacterium]